MNSGTKTAAPARVRRAVAGLCLAALAGCQFPAAADESGTVDAADCADIDGCAGVLADTGAPTSDTLADAQPPGSETVVEGGAIDGTSASPAPKWGCTTDFAATCASTAAVHAFNYISIAAPSSAQVMVDGKLLTPDWFKKIGKDYKRSRLFMGTGPHQVSATQPVSVEVYGWSQYISYAYPAGMKLDNLGMVSVP